MKKDSRVYADRRKYIIQAVAKRVQATHIIGQYQYVLSYSHSKCQQSNHVGL